MILSTEDDEFVQQSLNDELRKKRLATLHVVRLISEIAIFAVVGLMLLSLWMINPNRLREVSPIPLIVFFLFGKTFFDRADNEIKILKLAAALQTAQQTKDDKVSS